MSGLNREEQENCKKAKTAVEFFKSMEADFRKEMAIQEGVSVTVELGLLFNLIESLSANGLIRPSDNKSVRGQVKAFVPSGFLSAFALLPEARNLALIDGVPGAAEIARRPEAFYRFM